MPSNPTSDNPPLHTKTGRATELSLVQACWPVPAGRECMRIQNGCAMTRDYMIPMRAETALFCGKWYGNAGLTAC